MRLHVIILASCMLITGSINTIATKLQDNVVVGEDSKGRPLTFKHPAVQTAFMFAGESLCLIPFLLRRWWKSASGKNDYLSEEEKADSARRLRKSFWLFAIPAACDAGATTLLNLGLYYTYASVFQMLRGTLVIFAGLLTIVLLKRRLFNHHWLGMVLITAGAALVGASSIIYSSSDSSKDANLWDALLSLVQSKRNRAPSAAPNPLLGDVLVVLAQLLAATQFVVEEKFLAKYHAPVLMAVGMEGFWGVLLSCAALPLLGSVRGPDGLPLDSLGEAVQQIRASWTLQWTTALTITSIGFFNFFGVSVTKKLSGASRATIDACRTLFIWLFSLHMGWERFHMLQVVGFIVLVSGTSVYNEILRTFLPAPHRRRRRHRRRQQLQGEAAGREGGLEEGDLRQPLLGAAEGGQAGLAAGREQRPGVVRFAPGTAKAEEGQGGPARGERRPPLPARPRPIDRSYTMARSVTILPAALSPHSLASLPPGFSYSTSYGESLPVGSNMPSSFVSSTGMGSSPEDEMGASSSAAPASGAEEDLLESEFSESDVGEMSGHGGSRALDRLAQARGGRRGA